MRSLTKLLPTQVAERWALIRKSCIECAMIDPRLPEDEQANNLLQMFLVGGYEAWVGYEDEKFAGFVFTTIFFNVAGVRTFHVLGLWTPSGFTDEMFYACLQTLSTYAKSKGCIELNTNTIIKPLVNRLVRLGGKIKHVQIAFDL